jgi:hypothetical protein
VTTGRLTIIDTTASNMLRTAEGFLRGGNAKALREAADMLEENHPGDLFWQNQADLFRLGAYVCEAVKARSKGAL